MMEHPSAHWLATQSAVWQVNNHLGGDSDDGKSSRKRTDAFFSTLALADGGVHGYRPDGELF
jgi:hypothetical protein